MDWLARSADGTPIAVFAWGEEQNPPLVLVHGTTGDHTAFRVVAPMLAERFAVHAIDRRGRGESGDAPDYSITREFEDLVAVVEALAGTRDRAVDVLGHSFGGRCCLGAALRTPAIRRLVVYEGAPETAGASFGPPGFDARFADLMADGRPADALEAFYRAVVGMDDEMIEMYRSSPTWPMRVAAAGTVLREYHGAADEAAGLDALSAVDRPVLQLTGSDSPPAFRAACEALDARLPDARLAVIDGAAHAAHHTHPAAFVALATEFLLGPP